MYKRQIQKEERGEAVEFTDVFKGFDDFVPALLAVLLSSPVSYTHLTPPASDLG